MPSVRPKLVQEGAPIVGSVDSNDNDVAMIGPSVRNSGNSNQFVIGGNASWKPSTSSLMNASTSCPDHEMTTTATPSRHLSGGGGGKKSSLARAAKGTFIVENKSAKKKPAVQTSFVVGGNSVVHDEKKSADSSHAMMDDSSGRGTKTRTSGVVSTSFQVPFNNNSADHNNYHESNIHSQMTPMEVDPKPPVATKFVVAPTSTSQAPSYIEVAAPTMQHASERMSADPMPEIEKMEGVIDLSEKAPMVVIDGANIAYAYDKAGQGGSGLDKPEPDARGIVVACEYFLAAGIRVLAVIPSTWTHRDPYQRILKKLEQQALLVAAPSQDDDDAYAITIARREDAKSKERGHGPGYILSNDMFRDAMLRGKAQGGGADLVSWLMQGSTRDNGPTGPGRISYTFCDTGKSAQFKLQPS
jgi:Zc3h12a-like Ribonuclease NYN domain